MIRPGLCLPWVLGVLVTLVATPWLEAQDETASATTAWEFSVGVAPSFPHEFDDPCRSSGGRPVLLGARGVRSLSPSFRAEAELVGARNLSWFGSTTDCALPACVPGSSCARPVGTIGPGLVAGAFRFAFEPRASTRTNTTPRVSSGIGNLIGDDAWFLSLSVGARLPRNEGRNLLLELDTWFVHSPVQLLDYQTSPATIESSHREWAPVFFLRISFSG